MSEEDKRKHEDDALSALVDELTSRGRQAAVVRNPDRVNADPLTVDAILSIDGQDWAVDHFVLAWQPDLVGALEAADRLLQPQLDALVQAHTCGLLVRYRPHSRDKYTRQQIADYYCAVVALAKDAVRTGDASLEDGATFAFSFPSEPPVVHLQADTDTSPDGSIWLGDQIEAGLTTLRKKLSGQLLTAKAAGLRVAILIDQTSRPNSKQSSMGGTPAASIAKVTQRILNEHPGVVDQVWLRPAIRLRFDQGPKVHLLIADASLDLDGRG